MVLNISTHGKETLTAIASHLELRRASSVKRRARFWKVGALSGIVIAGLLLFFVDADAVAKLLMIGFFIAAGALVGFGLGHGTVSEVESDARRDLIGAIASQHGLQFTFSDFEPDLIESFQSAQLLPQSWDRATFNDRLSGSHEGHAFVSWGAHCEDEQRETRTNSKGETESKTRWVTVFRGRVYAIDWHQPFHGRTFIARRSWLSPFTPPDTFEITPTDPRFVDDFSIFTTDGTEGHFLLDPLMIERLIALESANEGSKLRGAFLDGRLFLVLDGPDQLVDFDMGKPLDSDETLHLIEQKITKALALVDQVR
jgi:hypothetical protein